MPFIDDLRNTTTPVTITRGTTVFTLNAALEKMTPNDRTYIILRQQRVEQHIAAEALGLRLAEETAMLQANTDTNVLRELVSRSRSTEAADPASPAPTRREKRKALMAVTSTELSAKHDELMSASEQRLNRLEVETGQNRNAQLLAAAACLAYLVPSSDLVNADGTPALDTPATPIYDIEDLFKPKVVADAEGVETTQPAILGAEARALVAVIPAELMHATQTFFHYFGERLLEHSLHEVEKAVYAPLGTSGSSDD